MMKNIYGAGDIGLTNKNLTTTVSFKNTEPILSFAQVNDVIESNSGYLTSKTIGWRAVIDVTLSNVINEDYHLLRTLFEDIVSNGEFYVYPYVDDNHLWTTIQHRYLCTIEGSVDIDDIFDRIEIGQYVDLRFESVELLKDLPFYITN